MVLQGVLGDSAGYARTACLPCRRGKRRCDRALPRCTLCAHKDAECGYPARRAQEKDMAGGGSDTSPPPRAPSAAAAGSLASETAAICFLVPQVFRQSRLRLAMPRLDPPVPADAAALVGDTARIRRTAAAFFDTVHFWMPIVCKRGFFGHLLNPLSGRQTELGLLALSMQLLSSSDEGGIGSDSRVYQIAKRFHFEVQAAGILSVPVLQAGILIALFEMGQAIYPAAYLSIGDCARYGTALGLHRMDRDRMGGDGGRAGGGDSCDDGPRSWLDIEERRRVWWAVMILDRCMNLHNPGRPTATEDPTFDTFLPVDDVAWDEGRTSPQDAVSISCGFELRMGLYSRLAQATFLVSQTLQFLAPPIAAAESETGSATPETITVRGQDDETAQLRRTLLALVTLSNREARVRHLEFCSQSALCYTSILLLQEHQWQRQGEMSGGNSSTSLFNTLSDEARLSLDELSDTGNLLCTSFHDSPCLFERIPLLLLVLIYQAGVIYIYLSLGSEGGGGGGTADYASWAKERLKKHKELLRIIAPRWGLAGVYLTILEAKEVTTSVEVPVMIS